MFEQILVKRPVGSRKLLKGQREDLLRLGSVAKRRRFSLQSSKSLGEHRSHRCSGIRPLLGAGSDRCCGPRVALGLNLGEEFVYRLPDRGVKRPGREVEVAQQGRCRVVGRLRCVRCCHRAGCLRGWLDTDRTSHSLSSSRPFQAVMFFSLYKFEGIVSWGMFEAETLLPGNKP